MPKAVKERRIGITHLLLLFTLVACLIGDAFFHRKIMKWSARLTVFLQSIGGYIGAEICIILSGPFTYLPAAYVFLCILISNSFKQLVYHSLLYSSVISIDLALKIIYGRGRPFLFDSEIENYHCACDYGMPSGHTGTSICVYYLLSAYTSTLLSGNYL